MAASTQSEIALVEPGRFVSQTGPAPVETPPGHARLRVRKIGVCGTDIHAFYGRQPFFDYPRILGHELGAEILEINGDSELKSGQLVAVEPYLNNPDSPASQRGKTNCCEELEVLGIHTDGGMRPEIVMPLEKLHASQSATADQLALVEMLCIGAHAVDRADIQPDDYAVVLGAGPIGMSVLQFLQTQTDLATIADINRDRLEFCRDGLGVGRTLALDPDAGSIEPALRDLGGGVLPTVIFDVTGNPGSMMRCFELIGHGGTIVFVGLFQGDVTFSDPNFHRREITLKSSRNATASTFGRVIQAIESNEIDTAPWITHRLPLSQVPCQFEEIVTDPGLRKAVIEVD
ncbi:MAG: zinc-binding alcohol dehydrogenase family protein [Verrucomicrobiales bacterium]|nr:zinc-binding alcohol dehydrogenase family protein [Verrucomicrobiales bacterium]